MSSAKHSKIANYTVLKTISGKTQFPLIKFKQALDSSLNPCLLKIWYPIAGNDFTALFQYELTILQKVKERPVRPKGLPILLESGQAEYFRKNNSKGNVIVKYQVFALPQFGQVQKLICCKPKRNEALVLSKNYLEALVNVQSLGYSVIHLNINSLFVDNGLQVLILDLFTACRLRIHEQEIQLDSRCYNLNYLAPQIHLQRKIPNSLFADAHLAGLFTFYLLFQSPPFFQSFSSKDSYYKLICANHFDQFWRCHPKAKKNTQVSQEDKAILSFMLHSDPDLRMGVQAALQSNIFNNLDQASALQKLKSSRQKIDIQQKKKQQSKKNSQLKHKMPKSIIFSGVGHCRDIAHNFSSLCSDFQFPPFEQSYLGPNHLYVNVPPQTTLQILLEIGKYFNMMELKHNKITCQHMGKQSVDSFVLRMQVFSLEEDSVISFKRMEDSLNGWWEFIETVNEAKERIQNQIKNL